MALISFNDWLVKIRESSPQTRLMKGPYRTLSASPFTHSTPSPDAVEDILANLGKHGTDGKVKKRKKRKKKIGSKKK